MSSTQKPIVIVGSINIDLVVTSPRIPVAGETIWGHEFQQHFGGKGANQAVAVARLGYPVEMIGRIGSDSLGAQARAALQEAGVGVEAVEIAEGSSGIASITVSESGQNAIVVVPGANTQVTPEYLDRHRKRIESAGMVLTQLEIPMRTVEHLAEICDRSRIPLMLDPAPAQPLPAATLSRVAWFTPNETEAAFYADGIDPALVASDPQSLAKAFLRMGPKAAVLKMGARGVLLASHTKVETLPAISVAAVDSTAAGDAFNGAFATGLILAMDELEAARFACAAAAISVTRRGAQSSMPSRAEVDHLLKVQA